MANENASLNNDYRSSPRIPGAAHDEGSIRRYDLKNDMVSVVNSGESDPTPAQELSEAYEDPIEMAGDNTRSEDEANPTNHNPGADRITAMDRAEEVDVADVDELAMSAHTGDPENPTDSAVSPIGDDDNDFEYQQQMVEEGGPDSEAQLAKEDVA